MLRQTFNTDCRKVLATLANESVQGVFTDPPYNIDLTPQRGTHGQIINDALTAEEFDTLLSTVSAELYRVLTRDSVAWICCNWECFDIFRLHFRNAGFTIKNTVVWVKNNFGLGNHFRPQHEFILVCFKGEPPVPEHAISNVWEVERLVKTIHPTEKPIKLIQKALRQYNKEGDIILDPFAGSLSTPLAAKQLGMGYIAIEQDKTWYTPGLERLETGSVTIVNGNGKTVSSVQGSPLADLFV